MNNHTDEELLTLTQTGDEEAETRLLEKYKPLVRACARELYLAGGEKEDLIQEGMMGLFKAIRSYNAEKGASFATYARLLISRQIYNAVAAAQRQKHQILNQSVTLSGYEEEREDGTGRVADSPETIFLDLETTRELRQKIDDHLSPLEREVLAWYLQGYDYLQIAEKTGRTAKSIDNALQRIRGKVSHLLFA